MNLSCIHKWHTNIMFENEILLALVIIQIFIIYIIHTSNLYSLKYFFKDFKISLQQKQLSFYCLIHLAQLSKVKNNGKLELTTSFGTLLRSFLLNKITCCICVMFLTGFCVLFQNNNYALNDAHLRMDTCSPVVFLHVKIIELKTNTYNKAKSQ